MDNNGRPAYLDNQYQTWLEDMKPFLKGGCSLNRAIEGAGLDRHKDSIYRKSKLNDWFCEKINAYRTYIGELVNHTFGVKVTEIYNRTVCHGEPLTKLDAKIICFLATKHRSCQPFFVTRNETHQARQVDAKRILDKLERNDGL